MLNANTKHKNNFYLVELKFLKYISFQIHLFKKLHLLSINFKKEKIKQAIWGDLFLKPLGFI